VAFRNFRQFFSTFFAFWWADLLGSNHHLTFPPLGRGCVVLKDRKEWRLTISFITYRSLASPVFYTPKKAVMVKAYSSP